MTFHRLRLTVSAAVSLASLAATTPANLHFEALRQTSESTPFCTASRDLCISAKSDEDSTTLTLTENGRATAQWQVEKGDDQADIAVIPDILRLHDGRLLASYGAAISQMYSGGGGQAVTRHVMLIRPGKSPIEVLSVPDSSDITIRACFSEKDSKQRRGACQDEYTLASSLTVAPGNTAPMPDLILHVKATRFPRGVSRDADSLAMPPLKAADLVTTLDAKCTYTRRLHFDGTSQRYLPDAPLPDCSEYTEP